jgi:hypothetical protein
MPIMTGQLLRKSIIDSSPFRLGVGGINGGPASRDGRHRKLLIAPVFYRAKYRDASTSLKKFVFSPFSNRRGVLLGCIDIS